MRHRSAPWALAALAACSGNPDGSASTPAAPATTAPVPEPKLTEEQERAHHVVFADRTSYAYLLLLPDRRAGKPPSRANLVALVKEKLADRLHHEEVALLIKVIETDPETTRHPGNMLDPSQIGQSDADLTAFSASQQSDLLGLYIDLLEITAEPDHPLIPLRSFADPVLTRELSPQERDSLVDRTHALLLRVEYRNQYGVRGLRLLQTLTMLVAERERALIHDWDVGETLNLAAFERRRLNSGLGNIADQIAVVPFPALKAGTGTVRLSTRGMRRFGSPELELDGLTADVQSLQRATHMLYGLAYFVAQHGQVHSSGLAMEADDELVVTFGDIEHAYAGRGASLTRCSDCAEATAVHLVTRPAEPTDPRGHPVVRVVAPRRQSDAREYDHAAWVRAAVEDLLGP